MPLICPFREKMLQEQHKTKHSCAIVNMMTMNLSDGMKHQLNSNSSLVLLWKSTAALTFVR